MRHAPRPPGLGPRATGRASRGLGVAAGPGGASSGVGGGRDGITVLVPVRTATRKRTRTGRGRRSGACGVSPRLADVHTHRGSAGRGASTCCLLGRGGGGGGGSGCSTIRAWVGCRGRQPPTTPGTGSSGPRVHTTTTTTTTTTPTTTTTTTSSSSSRRSRRRRSSNRRGGSSGVRCIAAWGWTTTMSRRCSPSPHPTCRVRSVQPTPTPAPTPTPRTKPVRPQPVTTAAHGAPWACTTVVAAWGAPAVRQDGTGGVRREHRAPVIQVACLIGPRPVRRGRGRGPCDAVRGGTTVCGAGGSAAGRG